MTCKCGEKGKHFIPSEGWFCDRCWAERNKRPQAHSFILKGTGWTS